ncbi:hypothetical protein PF005_g2401 [Phytophthora fragariae]|uniref:Uncharacterized protein n=1 Tax=Phytophthora fragariae TaxID=53985 RepID=A0A6A3UU02_9STRA|nr:hypothetical protein PF003_g30927 [Phytophthora fragariae]KAE8947808.1 hypothetical protein PF009_g2584 [Phytophthora fragariae]KAE9136006.1 hypothetical protein PF007_g2345 [Phytophthora fragariae]KAE9154171.1 hypothetical protein PF006_g1761 [Phytophthora fragariae]KAE9233243.1 hypothetical protein PF005_g2401 [Phytophthora fragariae]
MTRLGWHRPVHAAGTGRPAIVCSWPAAWHCRASASPTASLSASLIKIIAVCH